MGSSLSGPEVLLTITTGGRRHRFAPAQPYSLDESELDFERRAALSIEGLEPGSFRLTTKTGTIEQTRSGFEWAPFTPGDIVFGRLEIACLADAGQFRFCVELAPSRVTAMHWNRLVRDLRQLSDALLTSFFSASNVRVPAAQSGAHVLGSVLFTQLETTMSGLLSSVAAIARNPRRDFLPGRPQAEHRPHTPSTEIYENAIIWLSVESLLETLKQAERSCYDEHADLKKEMSFFKPKKDGKGGYEVREEKALSLERAAQQLRDWHSRLALLARQLPAEKVARGLRGTPPHLSARLQGNAHYVRVVRLAVRLGRERMLEGESRWRSTLSARRSSTVFEYWALFALLRSLGALGYGSINVDLRTFLRSEPFEATPQANTEFLLRNESRKETLALCYEVLAKGFPPSRKKGSTQEWHADIAAARVEGLFAKSYTLTPDFWLELRSDDGPVVASIGDAIFTDQVDGPFGIRAKGEKVATYVKNIVRARGGQPLVKASEIGFVIHCNDTPAGAAALAEQDHAFFSFVPRVASELKDPFVINPETLQQIEEYLQTLRMEFSSAKAVSP